MVGSLRPSHTSSHIAEAGGLAQLRRDVPETDCTLVVIIVGLTLLRLTLREPSPNRGSDECRARGEVTAIDPNADIARLAQGRPPPPPDRLYVVQGIRHCAGGSLDVLLSTSVWRHRIPKYLPCQGSCIPLAVYERHAVQGGSGMEGSGWVGRGNTTTATLSQVGEGIYRMRECWTHDRPVSVTSDLFSVLPFGRFLILACRKLYSCHGSWPEPTSATVTSRAGYWNLIDSYILEEGNSLSIEGGQFYLAESLLGSLEEAHNYPAITGISFLLSGFELSPPTSTTPTLTPIKWQSSRVHIYL